GVDHRRGEEPDGHLTPTAVHLDVRVVHDDLAGAALERLLAQPQIGDVAGQQVDGDVAVDVRVRADVVEHTAVADSGVDPGVAAHVDAPAFAEVDLTAQLQAQDERARVDRNVAVALDGSRGLPGDEALPGEGGRGHVGHGIDGHPGECGAQVPAVIGVGRLRDVGDRQRFRRRHGATQTEENQCNGANTKSSEHEHPP